MKNCFLFLWILFVMVPIGVYYKLKETFKEYSEKTISISTIVIVILVLPITLLILIVIGILMLLGSIFNRND